jgi:hypothetical protein
MFWRVIVFLGCLCASVYAQQSVKPTVRQSGKITPGHGANWVTTGVIADSGAPSGGVGLVGSFVINDMLCASATGTSISVIDCGFSATGTNNWVGLQNLNGGATAPTRPANDSTTTSHTHMELKHVHKLEDYARRRWSHSRRCCEPGHDVLERAG